MNLGSCTDEEAEAHAMYTQHDISGVVCAGSTALAAGSPHFSHRCISLITSFVDFLLC